MRRFYRDAITPLLEIEMKIMDVDLWIGKQVSYLDADEAGLDYMHFIGERMREYAKATEPLKAMINNWVRESTEEI
jgi:hypothetical protein